MSSTPTDLRAMADWDGKGLVSRQKLMEHLQSKFLIPGKYLFVQTLPNKQIDDHILQYLVIIYYSIITV